MRIKNFKLKNNSGMTYVELIVVMSIFAIISSVGLFNYHNFQAKVDIKNLANDIGLKVVEAEKSSTGGSIPFNKNIPVLDPVWKPSYGIYLDSLPSGETSRTKLYYFTDLDQNKSFDGITNVSCPPGDGVTDNECLDVINIVNRNFISEISVIYLNDPTPQIISDNLSMTFTRPDSVATFYSNGVALQAVDYIQIKISSGNGGAKANIKVHASGRIEIN